MLFNAPFLSGSFGQVRGSEFSETSTVFDLRDFECSVPFGPIGFDLGHNTSESFPDTIEAIGPLFKDSV